MVFRIVTGIILRTVSCNFIFSHSVARGNRYKLTQKLVHYNLSFFANRIIPTWNSFLDYVVSACKVKVFEKRLDLFWIILNYKTTITGIRSRIVI